MFHHFQLKKVSSTNGSQSAPSYGFMGTHVPLPFLRILLPDGLLFIDDATNQHPGRVDADKHVRENVHVLGGK
jgi:hypothetical protein